jgi:hypothetical protein
VSASEFVFHVSQPLTFEACANVMSAVAGVPANLDIGETDGNPYDTYWRTVEIRATRANGDFLSLGFSQNVSSSSEDPRTITESFNVRWYVAKEPFAAKRRIWHALRDAFAALGCTSEEEKWLGQ